MRHTKRKKNKHTSHRRLRGGDDTSNTGIFGKIANFYHSTANALKNRIASFSFKSPFTSATASAVPASTTAAFDISSSTPPIQEEPTTTPTIENTSASLNLSPASSVPEQSMLAPSSAEISANNDNVAAASVPQQPQSAGRHRGRKHGRGRSRGRSHSKHIKTRKRKYRRSSGGAAANILYKTATPQTWTR